MVYLAVNLIDCTTAAGVLMYYNVYSIFSFNEIDYLTYINL